jgi:hypothetical protein
MDIRKLEITEKELKLGTQIYYEGDIKSFPKAEADEYVRMGWAKCVETGEENERKPGVQAINVHNVQGTAQTLS